MLYTICIRIRHTAYGPPLRLFEYYSDQLLANTAFASWSELAKTPGSIVDKVDMHSNQGSVLLGVSEKEGTKTNAEINGSKQNRNQQAAQPVSSSS